MLQLNEREIVFRTWAQEMRPAPPIAPSTWAAQNLVVPDGPQAGRRFDLALTAYLAEPLDMLGPDSPVNEIAVMKSAQGGFTLLLIALIGHLIDRNPTRIMVVQPTDAAVSEFNREKLDPAIKATAALRRKVEPQTPRAGEGSTTYSKKFPGGSLTLAISTSAADLRSKTVKILLRDEIDQYPDDLDGQGNPLDISDARLTAFLASGEWKKADISTPTIKGASKIEKRYEAGDQRRWHVPCPGCKSEFVFEFGSQFRFETNFPHRAFYVSPCCGTVVEHHQKLKLVRKGRWIAGATRPGAFPSYHFDALSSPFVPWDDIAEKFVAAGDDQQKAKAFFNLTLGRPYEIKGDAPDHVRLMERREGGLTKGHIPADGVMLVAAADVQMRGIWVEVVAYAPNRESWVVDALYLDGSTESVEGEAFQQLVGVLHRQYPDAFGGVRMLDALGVDSGYRAHVVYAWTRAHQRIHPDTGRESVLALKGMDGWGKPAIGLPSLVDIDLDGRKVHKGARVWPVGTWPLKAAFYADVKKDGIKSGADIDPDGYCHFPTWLDENYFKQITSEWLTDEKIRGKVSRVWKLRSSERDNHFFDCRVYNMALAEHLGLRAGPGS
jgi:phage terminase large subunit GpA-like protein